MPKLPKIFFIMSPTNGMLATPVAASTFEVHLLTSRGMQADTLSWGRLPMLAGFRTLLTVPSTDATHADTFTGRLAVASTRLDAGRDLGRQGGRVGQGPGRRDQVLHARRQLHRQVVEDRRDVGDGGQGDVGEGDRGEGGRGEVGAPTDTVPAGVSTVPRLRGGCSGVQRGQNRRVGTDASTLFTMSVAAATVWAGSPVGTFRGLMALMAPPTVPCTGPGRTPAAAPATVMVANAVVRRDRGLGRGSHSGDLADQR